MDKFLKFLLMIIIGSFLSQGTASAIAKNRKVISNSGNSTYTPVVEYINKNHEDYVGGFVGTHQEYAINIAGVHFEREGNAVPYSAYNNDDEEVDNPRQSYRLRNMTKSSTSNSTFIGNETENAGNGTYAKSGASSSKGNLATGVFGAIVMAILSQIDLASS